MWSTSGGTCGQAPATNRNMAGYREVVECNAQLLALESGLGKFVCLCLDCHSPLMNSGCGLLSTYP